MRQTNPSKLTLTKDDEGLALTHEEFADADFQGPSRYERVQGRLLVMTPSGFEHHAAAEPFRDQLVVYKHSHPHIIEHVFQESWVIIDAGTERIPDLTVYLHTDREHPPFPERVPDLIFEIVSQSEADRRRDYEDKRAEYERIAVREYVIVDRFLHRLLVLRLEEGRFTETDLGPNDSYATPLLPGLEIPLADILGL